MKKKALKFQTNIGCECCVRQLAHYFSDTCIHNWNVDLHHPLKVLTVEDDVAAETVIEIVSKAGFQIEEINRLNRGEFSKHIILLN